VKVINQHRLDQLSKDAASSQRLRKNLNMHDDFGDPCQRLFNALEPGTYIRPHRHTSPAKAECFIAVRGRMALVVFDVSGEVEQVVRFDAGCETLAIEIPPGTWHSLISFESGSIFFETKPGPYAALSDKDFAPWAPKEGTSEANVFLSCLMGKLN
jgi:cupin fold WbuC family metalloprotein